ncbi:hypothetical protein [Paraburkholderia aspalathi]|uniref:hypothetical protein n=1 Tax=Paraburkholderia aspalathi TaxID=1324617 RepID=UPI001B069BF6|nr:hypothetical protein [Paraburkholderia aspalathi]CAE6826862.1 hypothetical protein R20943_06444 [Paraburkholderia aspalathi]
MNPRMLFVPDSTARLVLAELDTGASLTQAQLAMRTRRTLGSVCKALQLLICSGYVRQAGARVRRFGVSIGRRQFEFVRTNKALELDDGLPQLDAATMLELAALMGELVRASLEAQRSHA